MSLCGGIPYSELKPLYHIALTVVYQKITCTNHSRKNSLSMICMEVIVTKILSPAFIVMKLEAIGIVVVQLLGVWLD